MKKEIKQGNTMIHSKGKMVSERLVWQDPVMQLLNQNVVHADIGACNRGNDATYGCFGGGTAGRSNCVSGMTVTSE